MPKITDKPLLDLYATTVFLSEHSINFPHFSIITACNPLGVLLTEAENKALLLSLTKVISNYQFIPVIGASPDLSHQEPSYAVYCNKLEATKIAEKFSQNAIFWIEKDILSIEPVTMIFETTTIGTFSSRLNKKAEVGASAKQQLK